MHFNREAKGGAEKIKNVKFLTVSFSIIVTVRRAVSRPNDGRRNIIVGLLG